MNLLLYLCLGLGSLYFLLQLLVWLGLLLNPYRDMTAAGQPKVSILIAARNEENNIMHCLQSIEALSYPKHLTQVLIGDDQSEDRTAELVTNFIRDKHNYQLISINTTMGKAKGKANVLAHLARIANGDFFFVTDADIEVNPNWIESMLAAFEPGTGLVSGGTIGKGNNMQAMDWTYFMGILMGTSRWGIPCTAVGNNMALKREAYESTGGYEAIDFSVTEDYKLYACVRQKGWQTKNILTRGCTHVTQSLGSFSEVLHQRKRWLTGGRELPFYWWLIFSVFGLFHPVLLVCLFLQPATALQLWAVKAIFELLIANTLLLGLGRKPAVLSWLLYQPYSLLLNIVLFFFYYFPIPFRWKNRYYTQ